MTKPNHFLLISVLIVLLQSVLDNYISWGTPIYLMLTPIVACLMPNRIRGIPLLLGAFFLGLVTDLLGNGILGMGASAMTAMVLVRYPLIRAFTNENSMEKYTYPSPISMGIGRFIAYLLILYVIFLSVYVGWDCAGIVPTSVALGRIAVGTLLNAAIGYFFAWIVIREE